MLINVMNACRDSAVTCEIYESFLWNLENETPVRQK